MYQRIAVIGAGALGRRIAWTLGKNAVSVHLCDTSETSLEAARSYFNEQDDQVDGVSDRSSRIFTTVSLSESVGDADFIVESIPEDLAAKRSLFLQLEEHSTPNSVLATNSSSYPSRLLLEDESPLGLRTLNTHFYAPPEQPAVELMSSGKTDPEIVAAVTQFLVDLGLRPFIARAESVGFIYNRIWAAIKRESLSVVAEGVAKYVMASNADFDEDRFYNIRTFRAIGVSGTAG